MHCVLISTYELGRQPFGLASPAAWLKEAGAEVTVFDLAVQGLDEEAVQSADVVAFHLPMHTATRIAARGVARIKSLNPKAHLCFYGLYASMNESLLRRLGADAVIGGEYEAGLAQWVKGLEAQNRATDRDSEDGAQEPRCETTLSLARQQFRVPDRSGLPALSQYASLVVDREDGGRLQTRRVGYTEASRGCKHLCRHCPVVPVYQGALRIVQPHVVLADIRQQVERGAQHITFGDPDFFNGVGHALAVVQALHRDHPELTYDVTIKIEHLLRHSRHLKTLRETGCVLLTSAVESVDDRVLELLDKGHTRKDFFRVVELCRQLGLNLNPTFVPFTPWTSLAGYGELLGLLAELGLVHQVAPVQLAMRLLIPKGSRLLELSQIQKRVEPFDEEALVYPWRHPDPQVDELATEVARCVHDASLKDESRRRTFSRIWRLVAERVGSRPNAPPQAALLPRSAVPYLNEPWYC